MRFSALIWLVLIIPFIFCWRRFPSSTKMGYFFRIMTWLCLLLALINPEILWHTPRGNIIVLADRSPSISVNNRQKQNYLIGQLEKTRPANHHLAVISFEKSAAIERPLHGESFSEFSRSLKPGASNLTESLKLALATAPLYENSRLVVLSDGIWTKNNPLHFIPFLNQRKIKIDYVDLGSSTNDDFRVIDFQAPTVVNQGELFLLNVWVYSPEAVDADYQLYRGEQSISQGATKLKKGNTLLSFKDLISSTGPEEYSIVITPKVLNYDQVKENNSSRLLIGVSAKRPLIFLSPKGNSQLAELLRKSGFSISEFSKEHIPSLSLGTLSQYSGMIIENIPARSLGFANMQNIAAWVKETGNGLFTTGGEQMYGQGGYLDSPLADILPISMEVRKEHRKMSVGVSIILDRSGSMSMQTPQGIPKIALAAAGAANAIELLSPSDTISIGVVDTEYHTIIPPSPRNEALKNIKDVRSIDSMGGGINVYTGLLKAVTEVSTMPQKNRFIIMFADASDANEEGNYKELLQKATQAGITVSVVGLGTEKDYCADFLKDVAKRGNGRIFFSNIPEELPALFAEEVLTLTNSAFVKDLTPVKITPLWQTLGGETITSMPQLPGYNICYLKPNAQASAITQGEMTTPIVAHWQIGSGRCISYMGEADGQYARPLALWPSTTNFFTTITSWISNSHQELPNNMIATSIVENNKCLTNLFLDPASITQNIYTQMPKISYLIEQPGAPPVLRTGKFTWVEVDQLHCEIELETADTVIPIIEIEGKRYPLTPYCLPNSPEFSIDSQEKGPNCLKLLAQNTGGKEIIDISKQWEDITAGKQWVNLRHAFIILSLIFLLLDILQRRSLIFNFSQRFTLPKIEKKATKSQSLVQDKIKQSRTSHSEPISQNKGKITKEEEEEKVKNSLLSSMRQLKQRDKK